MSTESGIHSLGRRAWWMVLGIFALLREKGRELADDVAQRGEILDGPLRAKASEVCRTVEAEIREALASLRAALGRPIRARAGVASEDVAEVDRRVSELSERVGRVQSARNGTQEG